LAYFKQKEKDEENLEFIVKHQIGKINQLLDLAVKHIPNDNI